MRKKILILGANGLLGNALLSSMSENNSLKVLGTYRKSSKNIFYTKYKKNLIGNFYLNNFIKLEKLIKKFKPFCVINCIGITNKELNKSKIFNTFFINTYLPSVLNYMSKYYNFKFIHISTDCVFSGKDKFYYEKSFKSAFDLYGLSKSFGEEFFFHKNTLILRTSIIGHELDSKKGLLEWFLSQKKIIQGFCNVIYSGVTTNELSRIITLILKKNNIHGLYHVSSNPIRKFDLLSLIKKIYKIKIIIKKNNILKKKLVLKNNKFTNETGIKSNSWIRQINFMKNFYEKNRK